MRGLQHFIVTVIGAALLAALVQEAAAAAAYAKPTRAGVPISVDRKVGIRPPPPPSPAVSVGRTAGRADVSAAGEAAFSVPLTLPPGAGGLTPELSLEYRHRSRGGALGAGWSLGGLSVIARCPRNVAQDGVAGPVTQSGADRFCLDGQRLVVVNGAAYGGAGAEYRTELDGFARIRSFGTAGAGPQSFTVEAADGRVLEYGATADSRIDWSGRSPTPRAWAVNRVRDRAGNVIDYAYTEDAVNGSFSLAGIRYGANPAAGVAASHEVLLAYGLRPATDVDLHYVAGSSVRQVVRLERIDVLHDGALQRRFELGYEAALSSAGHSRLASVRECGRDAVDCLAPTVLTWQDGVPGLGAEQAYPQVLAAPPWIGEPRRWWTGDVNGDGRDDLVWTGGTASAPTLRYRLASASGALGSEVDTRIPAPNGAGAPIDYDGDGAQDVLMVSASGRWQVVRGGAAGLGTVIETNLACNAIDYRGADLDGDGLSDLVYSEVVDYTGNGLVVRVRYNTPGAGFAGGPVTLYEQGYHGGYEYLQGGNFLGRPGQRIDLDGDGREDLLMNEEYSIARISADQRMSDRFAGSFAGGAPADINGDGCTDFVYPNYDGRWRVRFSGCVVAGPSGVEIAGPAYGALRPALAVLDWNGDGRDDLLYADGSPNWKVVRSAGDSLLEALDTGIPHGAPTSVAVADFDGDGLDDLAARAADRLGRRLHTGTAPDLLRTVRDGFGVTAAFDYLPATDSAVHAKGTGAVYPQRDLQDGRPLVSTLSVSDGSGTGSLAVRAYHYAGLRSDPSGRGELGFAERVVTERVPAGLAVEETYRQDFPFTGLVAREVVRNASGAVLRDLTNTWRSLSAGSGSSARHHPYLAASRERSFEPGGTSGSDAYRTTSMTVTAIDSLSGLVTDRSVVVTEGTGGAHPGAARSERVQHLSVMNDSANWCLGRPRLSAMTASHTLQGGAAQTRTSALEWDGPACRPVHVEVEPGDAEWQVSVDLAYDAFGNLSRRTVTGAGMAPRSTTLSWGARGRFPERVTNPLSQATTIAWDEGLGRPLAVTDANGLVTRLEYDGFGREVAATLADGGRIAWTRQACAGDCDARARFRLREEATGPSGEALGSRIADVDAFGRVVRSVRRMPGGAQAGEGVDFDAWGRLARQHLLAWSGGAPAGYWQYAWDELGRLVGASLYAADGVPGRSVRYAYDGLSLTATDALGHATTRTASAWGDIVLVQEPPGGQTRYGYDAFGQLLQVDDAAGNRLADITYNLRGMKVAQSDLDAGAWTISRNALGEVVAQRDAKGQSTRFDYDLLGRMVRRTEAEGITSWTWGNSAASRNVGRLAAVSAPGYAESYAYDAWSRLVRRTITSDATYQYAYDYDAAGRLAALTYPASTSGFRLKLGYEYADSQPVRIRDLSAQGAVLWELGAVDAAGNVLDETLGGTLRVVSGFNPATGELEYRQAGAGGGTSVQDLAWRWDEAGNLVERRDGRRGSLETFQYDDADRLVQSIRNGVPDVGLRYDAIGNITWKSDVCAASTSCFGYDPARRHAVTVAGSDRYAYDANGNMASRGGSVVAWYSYNLPRSIARGANQSSFWYGPARDRWKQVATDAGVATTTVYVGDLLEKVTRAGKTTWRHYVEAPTGTAVIHLRHADGSAPRNYLLTRDHLGSTDAIVDAASATVLVREGFDPFGRRRGGNGSGLPGAADWAVIGAVTRDGFTGHEHLDNLGLIHMNGRVYDPAIGRFLSPDPVIQSPFQGQDLNRYAYVWNNPLSVVDPSGFEEVTCLQGPNGRCQGVTVIGLREWPGGGAAYSAWRTGSNGQAVSAAQRDPCGQDSSAAACTRLATHAAAREVGEVAPAYARENWTDGFLTELRQASLNAIPGWYFSAQAAAAYSRGDHIGAIAFWGAMTADVFALGRGSAAVQGARAVSDLIPAELARVVAGDRTLKTLGRPGVEDVFVVAADDIVGLNSAELAKRLTIPDSETFTVIRFPTPQSGIASPVFRTNAGFLQGGLTRGGAREFVIPNGPIPPGARIEVVRP